MSARGRARVGSWSCTHPLEVDSPHTSCSCRRLVSDDIPAQPRHFLIAMMISTIAVMTTVAEAHLLLLPQRMSDVIIVADLLD